MGSCLQVVVVVRVAAGIGQLVSALVLLNMVAKLRWIINHTTTPRPSIMQSYTRRLDAACLDRKQKSTIMVYGKSLNTRVSSSKLSWSLIM